LQDARRHHNEREVIILDPMLATGGSATAAITLLKEKYGCKSIKLMNIIAAPEGIACVQREHPDVEIYVAAVDSHLNSHGYIVPASATRATASSARNSRYIQINHQNIRGTRRNFPPRSAYVFLRCRPSYRKEMVRLAFFLVLYHIQLSGIPAGKGLCRGHRRPEGTKMPLFPAALPVYGLGAVALVSLPASLQGNVGVLVLCAALVASATEICRRHVLLALPRRALLGL
jgi:hypothetical protein